MKLTDLDFDLNTAQQLNELAKQSANTFVKKDRLKTHQLRNVFSAIEKMRTLHKRILKLDSRVKAGDEKARAAREKMESDLEMQLIMLQPKIAYAAGRQKSVRYNFFPLIEAAVGAVDRAEDKRGAYQKFFALMESVVGYHKFFES